MGTRQAPATLQLVAEIHNWVGSVTFIYKSLAAETGKNSTSKNVTIKTSLTKTGNNSTRKGKSSC